MAEIRLRFQSARTEGGEAHSARSVTCELDWSPQTPHTLAQPRPFDLKLRTWDKSDVAWYLEQYVGQPVGGFLHRAQEAEETLTRWETELLPAALGPDAGAIVAELVQAEGARYLTIESDASAILDLPWELAASGAESLAARGIVVRRRLPLPPHAGASPCSRRLRVLLVVSRPDELGYFDHRRTAHILHDIARQQPGQLEIDLCHPGTVERFEAMVATADAEGRPYGIIHFDGHGVYDPLLRRGELCFERALDGGGRAALERIDAKHFGGFLSRHSRPALIVFEACQTAQVTPALMGSYSPILGSVQDLEPFASSLGMNLREAVDLGQAMSPAQLRASAAGLAKEGLGALLHDGDLADVPIARSGVGAALTAGVEAVVGMSHSIHVDASAIFIRQCYLALLEGVSIGAAVVRGRKAMRDTPTRRALGGNTFDVTTVALNDWFVPQLYQALADSSLQPSETPAARLPEPEMPEPLIGRGAELLWLQRRVVNRRAVLVRGLAGVGKTALVRELVAWTSCGNEAPDGICWITLEDGVTSGQVLSRIAGELVPNGPVTTSPADVRQWLASRRALVVLDAVERAVRWNEPPAVDGASSGESVLDLIRWWIGAEGVTARLVLTARFGHDNPVSALGIDTLDLKGLGAVNAAALLERELEASMRPGASLSTLDEEIRLDLLARLAGNCRAIEAAAADWPDSPETSKPDDVDAWMERWARMGAPSGPGDVGLAASPIETLPESARLLLLLVRHLRSAVTTTSVARLAALSPEGWNEAFEALIRIGLAERTDATPPTLRLHPWLPYRLPALSLDADEQALDRTTAVIYDGLLPQINRNRPLLRSNLLPWLLLQWGNLRAQVRGAIDRQEPERAIAAGLLVDELLARWCPGRPRLRLLRKLESIRNPSQVDLLGLEVRLRVADWCLGHNQRNDAVALATVLVRDLSGPSPPPDPEVAAGALSHVAGLLGQAGYGHSAAIVQCRAAACWLEVVHGAPNDSPGPMSQLALCFGELSDLVFSGNDAQAWAFADREMRVMSIACGGNVPLEPALRFAKILVATGALERAESLFETLLAHPEAASDEFRAAWHECRGDIAARRKRFDEAADRCGRALKLYDRVADRRSIIRCYRHMGAICLGTGRQPEARSWFEAGLEMAWQAADVVLADAFITLIAGCDNTVLQALVLGGLAEPAERHRAAKQAFWDQQVPKLNGLREYCQEADAWARSAAGLRDHESPWTIPPEFSAAERICAFLQADAPDATPTRTLARTADEVLDQRLPTGGPQSLLAYTVTKAIVDAARG